MEEAKPKKDNKNIVIAIIVAGAVVVIAAIVVVLVLTLGGSNIKNIDDLNQAFKDKAAINCTLSKDSDSYTIQTTKGWDKFHIFGQQNHEEMDMYLIKGDAMYMSANGMDVKMAYDDSYINEFTKDIDGPSVGTDKDVKIDCKAPGQTDFRIPNKDWLDLSGMGGGLFEDE